jgi:hypothetical protein
MSYRIVMETERSGKQWFYVQKTFMVYFWVYLREVRDMSMCAYRIGWETLEEAESYLQREVNYQYKKSQQKIISREILNRN